MNLTAINSSQNTWSAWFEYNAKNACNPSIQAVLRVLYF